MNEQNILNVFSFVVVDDSSFGALMLGKKLRELGINSKYIYEEVTFENTCKYVIKAYKEGTFPVVLLGENSEGSSNIVRKLVDSYEHGGIIFPFSLSQDSLIPEWKNCLPEDSKWSIRRFDGVSEIELVCEEFLNNLHKDEESIELKNR